MRVLLGRDRPVEHPVDKAADARHRRFQLVRDVCHELVAPLLGALDALRHGIERRRQLQDLLGAAGRDADARFKIAVTKLPRRLSDLRQRAHLRAGEQARRCQRDHDGKRRRRQKQRGAAAHERVELRGRRGDDHIADRLPGGRGDDRHARETAAVGIQLRKRLAAARAADDAAACVDLAQQRRVHGLSDVLAQELLTRAQAHHAVGVADQRLGVTDG